MSVLTSVDITGIGAVAALRAFNSDSLCGIGRFTECRRHQSFIGEKEGSSKITEASWLVLNGCRAS